MKFKRRPLAWTALFFSLGITAAYYFSGFPYLFLALLVFILLFIVVNFNCNHFCKYFAVIMLIVFLIGFGRTYWQGVKYKSRNSIAYWNGEDSSLVTGRIQEDLSTLEGDKVYLKPYNINSHRVKYGLIQLDRRYLPRQVSEGEIVSLRLGLEQPAVKKNPGGFSYYKYLKKRGIFSIGYYQGGLKKLGTRPRFLRQIICSAKKKFLYLINQNINEPYSEIIKALVLGERENIPSEWEKNFTRAGANHLLAISGLHVGFIMLIFIGLMQITGLPEGVGNLICSLLLAGYILISGARVSVIRAGLITILFMWAPFFNRKADLFNIAGMTVIIILLLNPLYLFTVGFQLTYLVLFMIILWAGLLKDYYIPGLLNVSLAAQLGSLPIIAYYFNLATPAGLITNIWAIPLAALVVLTAITGLLLGLIHPVFLQTAGVLVTFILKVLNQGMTMMANLPFGHIELPTPPLLIVLLIYVLLFLLPFLAEKKVLPENKIKKRQRLWISSILISILILYSFISPLVEDNYLKVIFFSVGQGDGIYIKLPGGKDLIIDGGGRAGKRSMGEVVMLPYLKKEGIKELDAVFVTHFDTDHALGIKSLLRERKIGLLILPAGFRNNQLAGEILKMARERDIPVRQAARGDFLQTTYCQFRVLNPDSSGKGMEDKGNERSLVLRLIFKNLSILFTGDLGIEGEREILADGYRVDSDILKVGHHGSSGSSSIYFLKNVIPAEAVISVGKNNYGHPDDGVLNKLKDINARIWRTDRQGAIILESDGISYQLRGFCSTTN